MPKGVPNKRYTPEFKKLVIETMRQEGLSYSETARRFDVCNHHRNGKGFRVSMKDGSIITYREVSSSDGSPAVDIHIMSSSDDTGGVRTQKIHFVR